MNRTINRDNFVNRNGLRSGKEKKEYNLFVFLYWDLGVISLWSWMETRDMKHERNNPTVRGPVGTTRPHSSVLPEGFKWLNVPIPKDVHAHAHYMAGLSNMSLKEYVTWFLRTARPCTQADLSQTMPIVKAQPTSPDQGCSASHSWEVAVLHYVYELERELSHANHQHWWYKDKD